MAREPDKIDLARELQATLRARQELGTQYDDQFIQSLVDKLTAQVRHEVETARPARQRIDAGQRTAIAICSFIFLIPLVAVMGGGLGALLACLTVLGINLAVNL